VHKNIKPSKPFVAKTEFLLSSSIPTTQGERLANRRPHEQREQKMHEKKQNCGKFQFLNF